MRSCVADRQTDGRTDGAGYIGPAEGYGGSKNGGSSFERRGGCDNKVRRGARNLAGQNRVHGQGHRNRSNWRF